MKEIWETVVYRGIPYVNTYFVSNKGRVKSLKTGRYKTIKNKKSTKGYCVVDLYFRSKVKTALVHVLVWIAFKGKIKEGFVIHHKDSNGMNNRLDNLECITHRQNCSIERTNATGLPVGVCLKKGGKYRAQISIKKYHVYLGCYNFPNEASEAYQVALKLIQSNPTTTKDELQKSVSDYRESIGLKRLRINKKK